MAKAGCRIKKKLFKDQKKIILEGINHKFFRDQKKITLHENSTGSVSLRSWPDQKKIIRPGSLAKYDMKNCTQFWPGAHSLVKMYETHHARTTVVWQALVVVDVAAGGCCCAGACGRPTVKKKLEGCVGKGAAPPPNALVAGNHCRC